MGSMSPKRKSIYTKEEEEYWGDPEFIEAVAWVVLICLLALLLGFL
jgi:hypothetical protein